MHKRLLVFVGFVALLFLVPPLFAADCSGAPPESDGDYGVAALVLLTVFALAARQRPPAVAPRAETGEG